MRMRFKPYARPELLACDFHVHEPLTHGGHWHELYARPDQPWHLELGCRPTRISITSASTLQTRC